MTVVGGLYAYVSGDWGKWYCGSATIARKSAGRVAVRAAAVVGMFTPYQPGACPAKMRMAWWNHSTQSHGASLQVPVRGGCV